MPPEPFSNKEDYVATLSALWDRIVASAEIQEGLGGLGLVAKFQFTDYGNDLYVDARGEELCYYWDPDAPPAADVVMILSSETSHLFWMERLNVPLAIASRRIVARGSVQKALKLLPALRPAFAFYPEVLRARGKAHLLQEAAPARRRRGPWRWRFGRKPRECQADRLPDFPMSFSEATEKLAPTVARSELRPASDVDLLRMMYRIRRFEEHLSEAFRDGSLPTEAVHLSIGQEGVAAGVCMNLRDSDYLNTTHRGHGHLLAKGADMDRMMAEIYGRGAGLCGGKGGSMHVTDGELGILGANGIVGAGYLLALGAAWSIKHQGRDDLSVVIAGDGAVNQGMFHEALNMIALFELPVLVVVENNRYGEFTPVERHSAVPEAYRRAAAYAIEAERLDGNDAALLHERMAALTQAMREDGRPRLVELMTYRWHGHMEGDGERYRSEEEKARYREEDPIARMERRLVDTGVGQDQCEAMREEAAVEVAAAVRFAQEAAPPPPEACFSDIYAPEDRARFEAPFSEPDTARTTSMAGAIREAIAEEMARDETVFLWGEDVTLGGYFNVTEGLVEEFGTARIVDTPISENAIVGGAVGAAMTGMRPIVEILFADFLSCCMDPILNQAAKLRYMTGGQVAVPLTIRTPLGSGIGMAAQHSQAMERFFFGVPGLMVVAPADAYSAKGLLKSAIRSPNPVLFFEHKLLYASSGPAPEGDYTLPLGKARVVHPGNDITLVTHLLGVGVALLAAEELATEGIGVEVIDLATLYPLDTETILASVAKTGRLATLEEGPETGGIGAEVIARVTTAAHAHLRCAPRRLAAPECPIPYAKELEAMLLPNARDVAAALRGLANEG